MPIAGLPRIAVVMAKLMVNGEDFGIRPVVVALSDGFQMCKGVTSRYALVPGFSSQRSWRNRVEILTVISA